MDDTDADLRVVGRGGRDVDVTGVVSAAWRSDLDGADLRLDSRDGTAELLFRRGSSHAELDWAEVLLAHDAELDLSTGSGSVHVRDMDGPVRARASGFIDVDTRGPVELDGSSDVHASGSSGSVSTGSGDVFFVVDREASGTLRLFTGGGDVVVKLPHDVGVDVDAVASGGRVRIMAGGVQIDQPDAAQAQVAGGGTLTLQAESSGGDVLIGE
jgi:hypothetical protein